MRRAFGLLALLTAACAGPKPCTRTLCPLNVTGSYKMSGWNGSVTVDKSVPKPPVQPFTTVSIVDGQAEFANGDARVLAAAGTTFQFEVSTAAVPSLMVSAGTLSVSVSSGAAPAVIVAGSSVTLPARP